MRGCEPATLHGTRNCRLQVSQFGDLCPVERSVDRQTQTVERPRQKLEFEPIAFCGTDIGGKLDRVRDAVGLNLNIPPVDIIGRQIRRQVSAKPAALQADFIVGDTVRFRAVGNDDVIGIDSADESGPGVDDRSPEPCRYRCIGGQVGVRFP